MGSIINAACECGFNSQDIFAGGGFLSFRTSCIVPALCPKCSDIVVVNYLEKELECPECGESIGGCSADLTRVGAKTYHQADLRV